MYNNTIEVISYDIFSLSSNNSVNGEYMYIKGDIDYNGFVNTIHSNNSSLTFKVFNDSDTLVTSGNVSSNYKLKVYINDDIVDNYAILTEFVEVSNSLKKTDSNIIYDLKLGMKYDVLLQSISSNVIPVIKDKSNNIVNSDTVVKTGDTITYKLSSGDVVYKVSVLGDTNGDGVVRIGDVSQVFQAVRGKVTLNEVEKLSADTNRDGKILIGDVSKIFQYVRGKIANLD